MLNPRVLIIINRLVIGGQALDTVPLAYYLKDDFNVLVLYGEKEPDEEEALFLLKQYPNLAIKKIPGFRRSVNPFIDVVAFIKIFREIKHFNCSLIHTHGSKSGLLGRLAAKLAGVPSIVHTFHGHLFHSYYGNFISKLLVKIEKWLGCITTKIVAVSEWQKYELTEIYKVVSEDKVTVIHLGVDAAVFNPSPVCERERFRKKFQLNTQTVALGIIGRMVAIKNYELFVRIIIKLNLETKKELRFFIIGDGNVKNDVQQTLTKANIKWCTSCSFDPFALVVFTSWIANISEAINGLDIVVLTSSNEGTPLSLIEAQICGKPVVAANVGGVRNTFKNNETGFLIDGNDEKNYTEKLQVLIDDKEKRISMGREAAVFATQKFSKQQEITAFKKLYKNCLSTEADL